MRLESIQVGRPRRRSGPFRASFRSAIDKQPVLGPVQLGFENLEGDGQSDRRVHGGPERAVLAYSADHYPGWELELGRELARGVFGENLTISGLDEDAACLGDVYRIGGATIQVSEVRGPCYKLANHIQVADMINRVLASGHGGWYCRVVEPGLLAAGDPIELVARTNPGWTVRRAFQVFRNGGPEEVAALRALPEVSINWRSRLSAAVAR